MAHKASTRPRAIGGNGLRMDTAQPAPQQKTSAEGITALMEHAMQEALAVTYWFDPAPQPEPYAVTIRLSGRRVDVKGRLQAGDRFTQDETIEKVLPGSGPISLTARIRDINPGEWTVTAQVQGTTRPALGAKVQVLALPASAPRSLLARFWRRWAPPLDADKPIRTRPAFLARTPGILLGAWGGLVTLGVVLALLLQALVITTAHLLVGRWWAVSPGALVIGIIGAKLWYLTTYRRERLKNGWCIQGFITGATLGALTLLVLLGVPGGIFLDSATPGLLLAMAVGRMGCFFAGCCGGPPTASRWGVWSSDQRIGARRIPTQLMELSLTLSLGIITLGALLVHGPVGGAYFVAGLAGYTLVRQGILHLRAEARRTKWGLPITATVSALVLIAAIVFIVR